MKSNIILPDQFIEGKLTECISAGCKSCHCGEVGICYEEYYTFFEQDRKYWQSKGIIFGLIDDRVYIENCAYRHKCRFLKNPLDNQVDSRPNCCKIYPYHFDFTSVDLKTNIIELKLDITGCRVVKNNLLPDSFKKEVKKIAQRDFSKMYHKRNLAINLID